MVCNYLFVFLKKNTILLFCVLKYYLFKKGARKENYQQEFVLKPTQTWVVN